MDSFAGIVREEMPSRGRITSSIANLAGVSPAQEAGSVPTGGAQLIREEVHSGAKPSALSAGGAADGSFGATEAGTDLNRAASEMQLLVDLPADWPGWTLVRRTVKRTFDIAASLLALFVLLPFFAVVAVAIRLESSGPAFYRQRRCGRDGRSFQMLKFRSMVNGADRLVVDLRDSNESDGLLFKMRHDPRITRVGAFIRRYSIDELPQFVNVLKGEMSLVGPRPLPVDRDAFGPIDGKRHAVRPGLTCHWQVSGRSDVSYGQMVDMDLRYIRDSSIWTDLRLIVMTVPAALGGDGAY